MRRLPLRPLLSLAAPLLALALLVSGAHARVSSRDYLEQQLASSSDFRNRTQAALALGRMADPRSRAALERSLASDSNPAVRAASAVALGKLGDRAALVALRRAQRDDSASVRRQAESAIAELEGVGAASASATASTSAPPDWGRVRHVVSVGSISSASAFARGRLDGPLRAAVHEGLAGVQGVAAFGSVDQIPADATREITRRRIPRFRVDAVISDVQRTERQGELRLRCSVNLTLYDEATHGMRGMLSGAATAAEPIGQGSDQELRMATTALHAAVRGALSSAGSALDQASRRR